MIWLVFLILALILYSLIECVIMKMRGYISDSDGGWIKKSDYAAEQRQKELNWKKKESEDKKFCRSQFEKLMIDFPDEYQNLCKRLPFLNSPEYYERISRFDVRNLRAMLINERKGEKP